MNTKISITCCLCFVLSDGRVAEWSKASVLKTDGRKFRGFESLPSRHQCSVAQLVELGAHNPCMPVVRSHPEQSTMVGWPSGLRHWFAKPAGESPRGSNPLPTASGAFVVACVAQWQSARLWPELSRVRSPSYAPLF